MIKPDPRAPINWAEVAQAGLILVCGLVVFLFGLVGLLIWWPVDRALTKYLDK